MILVENTIRIINVLVQRSVDCIWGPNELKKIKYDVEKYFLRAQREKNQGGELLLDGMRGNFFDGGEWPLFIFDEGKISLMPYLPPHLTPSKKTSKICPNLPDPPPPPSQKIQIQKNSKIQKKILWSISKFI